ncbi:MAG: ATP-binding cassette domain-containing protein, partial [Synergistaceae bacterium]|nr:ATP-binding cassette domain-containing protein [Synergistaceae bacterium]
MVRTEGLHKTFHRLEVLKGIDIAVSKGEIVAIIGPSGSGKSTLLRCMNLLEFPTKGKV